MATNPDRKWSKRMTIEEMLPLMSDAEIDSNARRGGIAAIAERQRRIAEKQTAWNKAARGMGLFTSTAELLRSRRPSSPADRVMPDPPLDIGV